MIPIKDIRKYYQVNRTKHAQQFLDSFSKDLQQYALAHGGSISRNGYRVYLPFTGVLSDINADTEQNTQSWSWWLELRRTVKWRVAQKIMNHDGQEVESFDYINGIVDVAVTQQDGTKKIRRQKMGKFLNGLKEYVDCHDLKETVLLDAFCSDPIRLGRNIQEAVSKKQLMVCISNHIYDIVGMSTGRDWTSCMNIYSGDNAWYIHEDLKHGTMVAYIIDENDRNIQHPYGRVLLKPYKIRRKGHVGFDPAPIVYAPESTVYSAYVGLQPVRQWLKDICEQLQYGHGSLIPKRPLYNDNFHFKVDRVFHSKKTEPMT